MKTCLGVSAICLAAVVALATPTLAQTRNGTQSGASSSELNSEKDLPFLE